MAKRAGYTVSMFVIDVSKSMGRTRKVEQPDGSIVKMTHLQWAMQFVKLKIQELIFNERKTDQCGIVLFGTDETKNIVNDEHKDGYNNVYTLFQPAQPNADLLAELDNLSPSRLEGDVIDALIVALSVQGNYLAKKATWTRKLYLITDGESTWNTEDWEITADKFNETNTSLTILGVDFDDEDFGFKQEDKPATKAENEEFLQTFAKRVENGDMAAMGLALQEISRPDLREVAMTLSSGVLRVGDFDTRPDEALEIHIKTSKCTGLQRPKSFKKFGKRKGKDNVYVELKMRSEYYVDKRDEDAEMTDVKEDVEMEDKKDDDAEDLEPQQIQIDKSELIKGYKYGSTYTKCPDDDFPKLQTKAGMEICGFFLADNFRPELALGEVYYVYGDQPRNEIIIDAIARAMDTETPRYMAISRWVARANADPKMGVLAPCKFETEEGETMYCLLWTHMPFADDVRKYSFGALEHLISKKGDPITVHPYLPTTPQQEAMDHFVDALDLMDAGEKDEEGNRAPWFDTRLSYNPAIHRVKEALFHSAVVPDVAVHQLANPHPEILKYFDPPRKMLKRAHSQIEDCKSAFHVKEVPKKVVKARKDGHVHGRDEGDFNLLDRLPSKTTITKGQDAGSDTEDEHEGFLLDSVTPAAAVPVNEAEKLATPPAQPSRGFAMPTPARSLSPEYDMGRAPGRIVGSTFPLRDFQINQSNRADKAIDDLAQVILDIVRKPFVMKRSDELVECMTALRATAVKEDKVDQWNTFLKDLHRETKATKNQAFWEKIQGIGREIGLISKNENGSSDVNDNEAEEFLSK